MPFEKWLMHNYINLSYGHPDIWENVKMINKWFWRIWFFYNKNINVRTLDIYKHFYPWLGIYTKNNVQNVQKLCSNLCLKDMAVVSFVLIYIYKEIFGT